MADQALAHLKPAASARQPSAQPTRAVKTLAAELETIRARYRRNVFLYDRLDPRPFQGTAYVAHGVKES